MPSISSEFIQIQDLRLHYLLAQPLAPSKSTSTSARQRPSSQRDAFQTILFLHGFPEHAGVWREQLAFFSDNYRAIALDLPGYNLSQAPQDLVGFAVPRLVSVIADFIQQISEGQPVVLVAHDWGGALAWPLANRYPNLIDKLVILNAAHPSTFTREMIENPKQRVQSDYIHDFMSPSAEQHLAASDFKLLKAHSIDHIRVPIDAETIAEYEAAWSQPNAITNMLNYYRAMPQLFPREQAQDVLFEASDGQSSETSIMNNIKQSKDSRVLSEVLEDKNSRYQTPEKPLEAIKIPSIHITVPTLVLWGEMDQAFDIKVLNGLSDYISDYQELRFADASHWLHHEKPSEINAAIATFLS